ncbi:MAG TPA: response regulator transcription factor [Thermomicrobiales bacterium]|nr:response regulator transcription factor [Thermomicrobiales bacterium]
MAEESIIVVEDEPALAEALRFNLERQGYRVTVLHDCHAAVREIQRAGPDLVVLDVMLPGLDGFEVCRRVRMHSDVPILMLTARGEEVDRVLGLEIGADDYLTKPFSLRELQARVRALLRRSAVREPSSSQVQRQSGNLRVSPAERRAWLGETEISLRPREFDLLAYLIRNQALALSRQQILDGAWGNDFVGDERTVDVHIKGLRDLVEDDPRHPTRIVTVRGVGYRFEG